MNKNCSGCNKELDIVLNKYGVIDIFKSETVYSNNRCKDCFEKDFDKMSFEEQKPRFDRTLLMG